MACTKLLEIKFHHHDFHPIVCFREKDYVSKNPIAFFPFHGDESFRNHQSKKQLPGVKTGEA